MLEKPEWPGPVMELFCDGYEPCGAVRVGPLQQGRFEDAPATAYIHDGRAVIGYAWCEKQEFEGAGLLEADDLVWFVCAEQEYEPRLNQVEPEVLEPEESERRQWAEFGREKELARDAILRPRSNVASDAPSNQPVDAEGA